MTRTIEKPTIESIVKDMNELYDWMISRAQLMAFAEEGISENREEITEDDVKDAEVLWLRAALVLDEAALPDYGVSGYELSDDVRQSYEARKNFVLGRSENPQGLRN